MHKLAQNGDTILSHIFNKRILHSNVTKLWACINKKQYWKGIYMYRWNQKLVSWNMIYINESKLKRHIEKNSNYFLYHGRCHSISHNVTVNKCHVITHTVMTPCTRLVIIFKDRQNLLKKGNYKGEVIL